MRRAEADYAAIEAALAPHQLKTIHDYAAAIGRTSEDMWSNPLCCVLATALAVDNVLQMRLAEGWTERTALTHIAVTFDLDVETLLRRRRMAKRSASAGLVVR